MIGLFRETTISYIISVIIGAVWFFCLRFLLLPMTFIVHSWAFLIVWLLACLVVFFIIAQKKADKVNQILLNDCDPENCVKYFERFAKQRQYGRMRKYVFLNLATGYFALGKNTEIILTLGKVGKIPKGKRGLIYRFSYNRTLFYYHLRVLDDIYAAEENFKEVENLLRHPKCNEKQKAEWAKQVEVMQYLLRMERGDFDDFEELISILKEAESNWEKVGVNYTLGSLYLRLDKTTEAEEAFTYVALHGGTSIYQKLAVDELEKLGKEIQLPISDAKEPVIFTQKEKRKLYGIPIALILISAVLLAILVPARLEARRLERYHPTMAEAFANHRFGKDVFGEILFVSKYENTMSVLHKIEVSPNTFQRRISYFVTMENQGERVYFCINTGVVRSFIDFSKPPSPKRQLRGDIMATYEAANFANVDRVFGRRPILGLANSRDIYFLSINGQPVDYVIDIGYWTGEGHVFFWYFADAEVLYLQDLQNEDIEIVFEGLNESDTAAVDNEDIASYFEILSEHPAVFDYEGAAALLYRIPHEQIERARYYIENFVNLGGRAQPELSFPYNDIAANEDGLFEVRFPEDIMITVESFVDEFIFRGGSEENIIINDDGSVTVFYTLEQLECRWERLYRGITRTIRHGRSGVIINDVDLMVYYTTVPVIVDYDLFTEIVIFVDGYAYNRLNLTMPSRHTYAYRRFWLNVNNAAQLQMILGVPIDEWEVHIFVMDIHEGAILNKHSFP